jgi:hypothetical protein
MVYQRRLVVRPFTIDMQLIEAIERYADLAVGDPVLLGQVVAECPSASLREISRAALFAATDASRTDIRVTERLFNFAMAVRKAG